MTYLYGDATPFPLEENFLETLAAAADACVALFQIDGEVEDRRQQTAGIREHVSREIEHLEILSQVIDTALTPLLPDENPSYAAQRTARELAQGARTTIERARAMVLRDSEASVARVLGNDIGDRVVDALGAFLLRHQLPHTRWDIRWRYDLKSGRADLSMNNTTACQIAAAFTGQIPAGHRWASPVRLSDIDAQAQLSVPRHGSWLERLLKGARESLTGFYITSVEIGAEGARFEVHRQLKRPTTGYLIQVRGPGLDMPIIHRLAPEGERDSQTGPIPVRGEDAGGLMHLWSALESEMHTLRGLRARMVSASLGEVDVIHLEEPGEVAEVILTSLAPIVREMRLRSRVPGELVLKRDLGNGRREELFVPRSTLQEKFAALPYEQQLFFQSAGLGSEATVEFVDHAFLQGTRPTHRRPDSSAEPTLERGAAAA